MRLRLNYERLCLDIRMSGAGFTEPQHFRPADSWYSVYFVRLFPLLYKVRVALRTIGACNLSFWRNCLDFGNTLGLWGRPSPGTGISGDDMLGIQNPDLRWMHSPGWASHFLSCPRLSSGVHPDRIRSIHSSVFDRRTRCRDRSWR